MACIRSLITIRDTFPTTQTSNQKWNLSVPKIASSIYSLSETEHKVFNAMVVTDGIIGSVTPQALFQCSSLLFLMAKPVALSIGCRTGLRAKSFYSCSFLMHVVHIANHQYHLVLLRVPAVTHLVTASMCESDDSCFWNPFFSSIAFFQLENASFVNARSALDEVSIPLWSAFKQVWQQAASLISSWRNHLIRSNHTSYSKMAANKLFFCLHVN